MKYQQVSMIDDLPELDQIENTQREHYQEIEQPKVRGIRNKMVIHEDSGMNQTFSQEGAPRHNPMTPSTQFQNTNYMHQPYYSDSPQNINYAGHPQPQPQNEIVENLMMPSNNIDCRNIYDHISQCPICAKFYKHDNTFFIIIITILIVACALLLKRVLRV